MPIASVSFTKVSSKNNHHFSKMLFLGILMSVGIAGCSKAQKESSHDNTVNGDSGQPSPTAAKARMTVAPDASNVPASATADTAMTLGSQVATQQQNNPALANKKLVVTANAKFMVDDVVQSVTQIERLTVQNGGYIADSHIENNEVGESRYAIGNQQQKVLTRYVRQASMQVRIPKNQVAIFLAQLQNQIKFLENSQFKAKDVTLDLKKAQLEATIQASKQAVLEKQTLDNKTEKTQTGNVALIEQTTLAQQEKAYAELEQLGVQDQIELSTIELSFSQPEKLRVQIEPDIAAVIGSEKTQTFGSRLADNLKTGWVYFIEFVLWLSQFWMFMIGLGVLVWLLRWWGRHTPRLNLPKHNNFKPVGETTPMPVVTDADTPLE